MSTGRALVAVASTPSLTIPLGAAASVTLHARDAALVLAVIAALDEIQGKPYGWVRLDFTPTQVEAEVAVRVRRSP